MNWTFFSQVMHQCLILDARRALLVIGNVSNNELLVVKMKRNDEFCAEMLTTYKFFYDKYLCHHDVENASANPAAAITSLTLFQSNCSFDESDQAEKSLKYAADYFTKN